MKKIQVYKCDYCGKYLVNPTQMKKHEEICFYNPQSKSCVTCKNLCLISAIDGKPLTEREENIRQYKIEGTYSLITSHDEAHHCCLDEPYRYLYEADIENGCDAKEGILKKLTTNCDLYNSK